MAATREVTVALRLQSQMQDARRDLEEIARRLDKVGQAGRAAGEQTGLDRIGKDAADAARLIDAARERTQGLAQSIQAAASVGSGTSPFIAGLREQIALYGKGAEDVLRYRAAQAGLGAEAAPLILQLQNMRVAQEAAAAAALEEANAQRQAAAARQAATAQADAFIATLREQVALQGKSNADVLRYRAGTMGVGGQAAQYIAQIEAFEKAGQRGGVALNRFGVSAGQTAAAMRMLPAQITDITTSIASGMPVWMVAIQQGGQIKDSFGGWRAAGDALLKVLTPMRLVLGGVAVAAGVLIAAVIAGQRELSAYNMAVQSTGNYAGATRGQIEEMAASAAASGAITAGAAREAAVQMVQSGRLGMRTIGNLTRVVADYAAITGQSTAAAARALTDMFVKPTEGAEKLNAQFHFLSLEQYRYIRDLEEQGRVEEARLELSKRFAEHLGGTFVNNLGYLERAWLGVGNAVKGAWEWLKKWGAKPTIEMHVESQRQIVETLRTRLQKEQAGGGAPSRRAQQMAVELAAAERVLAQREAQRDAEQRDAAAVAEQKQMDARRIELEKKLEDLRKTLKTNRDKIADEKKLLDEALKLEVITPADYDKMLAATREKYRDRTPTKTPKTADPATTAFEQQRLALTQQLATAEQKLANEVFGLGTQQEAATAKLEAWLATSEQGRKLDAARVGKLRELAKALDGVAAEQDRVTDAAKRRERIDTGMQGVDAELARAAGHSVDAAIAEAKKRYAQLRKDLVEAGDGEGLLKIDKLIDMTAARAELDELRRQVDQVFAVQGREQQTVQAEIAAGLTSEYDGRLRLLDINSRTVAGVEALLPRMRELAALTGDPQMAAGIADLEARMGQMKLRADDLKLAFTDAFQSGLGDALADLATGTESLGDAVRNVIDGLTRSMAQFAANKLAEQTTSALMGGIGETVKAVQGLAPAFGQAAAAKVAADQAMTVSGVAATTTAATAATAAGAEVAAANAPAAAATATWSWGAAAVAGLAALAAIYALAKGFDAGGYTGPGGKYQPAGIVHAGEVVVRREVVQQRGMKELLLDINKHGARALQGLPQWPGFAEGGLVAPAVRARAALEGLPQWPGFAEGGLVPAANPSPSAREFPAPAQGSGSSVRFRTVNVLDPALFEDYVRSSPGEKTFLNFIRRNGTAVRTAMDGR